MIYKEHFKDADDFLCHVDGLIASMSNPLIEQRYLGFVAVSAVTVYELAMKDIFIGFCSKKNGVFGHYSRSRYERTNGRISLEDIRKNNLRLFGDKYLKRFNRKLDAAEMESLQIGGGSIKSSYGNIISWRNRFVHTGIPPNTTTFREVRSSYERGKAVFDCLADTMVR